MVMFPDNSPTGVSIVAIGSSLLSRWNAALSPGEPLPFEFDGVIRTVALLTSTPLASVRVFQTIEPEYPAGAILLTVPVIVAAVNPVPTSNSTKRSTCRLSESAIR